MRGYNSGFDVVFLSISIFKHNLFGMIKQRCKLIFYRTIHTVISKFLKE